MRGSHNNIRWRINANFWFFLAFLLLFVPLKWILAWIIAAFIHELSHYIVIRLFHHRVLEVKIGTSGMIIQTEPLPNHHELICALSGPLGGMLLIIFARWIPTIALCACIQSIYNLIPIFPFDGGRVIRCIASIFFKERTADYIIRIIEKIILSAVLVATIYSVFHYNLGFVPVLIITSVLFKLGLIKIPCKQTQLKVQ